MQPSHVTGMVFTYLFSQDMAQMSHNKPLWSKFLFVLDWYSRLYCSRRMFEVCMVRWRGLNRPQEQHSNDGKRQLLHLKTYISVNMQVFKHKYFPINHSWKYFHRYSKPTKSASSIWLTEEVDRTSSFGGTISSMSINRTFLVKITKRLKGYYVMPATTYIMIR